MALNFDSVANTLGAAASKQETEVSEFSKTMDPTNMRDQVVFQQKFNKMMQTYEFTGTLMKSLREVNDSLIRDIQ